MCALFHQRPRKALPGVGVLGYCYDHRTSEWADIAGPVSKAFLLLKLNKYLLSSGLLSGLAGIQFNCNSQETP